MDNKLRFHLEEQHPQKNQPSFEKWGRISISLLTAGGLKLLLQTEWSLAEFVQWFIENQEFIRSEVLSIDGHALISASESLAQGLKRLQEKEFSDDEQEAEDKWFDTLFEFRQHHCLRFALRGANISDIVIGCHRGAGEISLFDEKNDWFYSFDMEDFAEDLQQQLSEL